MRKIILMKIKLNKMNKLVKILKIMKIIKFYICHNNLIIRIRYHKILIANEKYKKIMN